VAASRAASVPARTKKFSPWYFSVMGQNRRHSRTTTLLLRIGLIRLEQQHLDAGEDEEPAEDVDDPGEALSSAAPSAIITPRMSSAPRMPQNSTRCW
jgi:hypothetical protein